MTQEMTKAAIVLQARTRAILTCRQQLPSTKDPSEDEEKAATALQAAARGGKERKKSPFVRKRAASAPDMMPSEEQQGAATKMQAMFRGRKARKEERHASNSRIRFASLGGLFDIKANAANRANHALVRARFRATVKALRMIVKGWVDGFEDTDPWTPQCEIDKMREDYLKTLNEITHRMEDKELEVKGRGSARLRHVIKKDLEPASWPSPPPANPPYIAWLRAKVLYALYPGDKLPTYFWNKDRWGLVPVALLWFPFFGVSTVSWLVLLLFTIVVDDQYQLVQYIWSFRVYALVVWGLLPLLGDHLAAFLYATAPWDATCASLFAQFSGAHLWVNRLFVLNWLLCYVVWGAYLAVRSEQTKSRRPINKLLYEKAESDSSSSSEDDGPSSPSSDSSVDPEALSNESVRRIRGDRGQAPKARATGYELALAMKFDVCATCAFFLLAHADLVYRVQGHRDALAYLRVWVTPYDAEGRGEHEEALRSLVHFDYQARFLALLALPWALFVIPFVGEMLHQLRITAFDQQGHLRLMLEPWQMKDKWDDELELEEARRRKQDKLEARASAKAAKQKEREKKAKKVHAQRKAIQDRLTRKGGAARDAAEMV